MLEETETLGKKQCYLSEEQPSSRARTSKPQYLQAPDTGDISLVLLSPSLSQEMSAGCGRLAALGQAHPEVISKGPFAPRALGCPWPTSTTQ